MIISTAGLQNGMAPKPDIQFYFDARDALIKAMANWNGWLDGLELRNSGRLLKMAR